MGLHRGSINSVQPVGRNAIIGIGELTWAANATAGTVQKASVTLPATVNGSGFYLISINNPAGLASSVTLNFQNQVNFGGTVGLVYSTITSVDVPTATTNEPAQDYLIQGWPMGDAAAQILATNDVTASGTGGTVTFVVRAV